MELLDAISRAEQNINFAYQHPNYKRTVELKKIYLQVLTGEDIDDLLPQFELREDKKLWKQRKALTIENLSPTISPICDKFYGVARIQPSKVMLAKNKEKQKFIEEAEKVFYNRQDLETYMDDILDEIGISDPNAFLAVSFEPFDEGDVPKIYPTIFGCEEVYDFVYKPDGSLDFLFVCQKVDVRGKMQKGTSVKTREVHDYYCISEGNALIFKEVVEERQLVLGEGEREWRSENGKLYYVKEVFVYSDAIKEQETPAIRLGYIQHKRHRAICISPIHPSLPILKDMIRDKSEYDVSKRCHVFPQKVMYDDACVGEIHLNPSRTCSGGYISGTKDTCSVCQGSGFRPHRSGQEIIRIKRPKTKDEFLPIDQIVTYITTNLEAVKMLGDDMERNAMRVESSIFSSGMRQRSNMQTQGKELPTATQMTISTDDYNYVLDAWAKNRGRWYCFVIRQAGAVFDTEVEVTYKYSGKYVMETQEDLINRLKSLADAGVSEQLIDEADLRIAKVMFDNDEVAMKRYLSKRVWLPFRGRGKDEVLVLLENENVPKATKILYANFQEIFQRLEDEQGIEFYDKDRKKQRAEIEKIIAEYKKTIEEEQPNDLLGLPKQVAGQTIPPAKPAPKQ
jgi:hypothetical protein